ncbi:hypothetical protein HCR_10060 [Hydrogenimonas cancrithermarum]|uniref:Uncharacterized protein n=1 Tax=Hydrogenimonas cancrithermarum TaxID=2993563 RepID=A0ABM8FK52_9BACT|nr:hypothetical protein HCR_10060 [Hydrogenimonas cancrithermarum]
MIKSVIIIIVDSKNKCSFLETYELRSTCCRADMVLGRRLEDIKEIDYDEIFFVKMFEDQDRILGSNWMYIFRPFNFKVQQQENQRRIIRRGQLR